MLSRRLLYNVLVAYEDTHKGHVFFRQTIVKVDRQADGQMGGHIYRDIERLTVRVRYEETEIWRDRDMKWQRYKETEIWRDRDINRLWTDRQKYEQTCKEMNRQEEIWTDRQSDEQIDRVMNR